MTNIYAKTGAAAYILWGLLHIQAARMVYILGETLESGMVQSRVFQDAWNLLIFALFGMLIAALFNWRNNLSGYWLNLLVVSAADIGYIYFVLIPGYVPWMPGGLGPLLWIIAVLFSTIGIMQKKR
jgi:hypothetical protein